MVQLISSGQRRAREPHQCFHCYRTIPAGETYEYHTRVYDDIYTLKMHLNCVEFNDAYLKGSGYHHNDFCDGYPPVADLLSDFSDMDETELFNLWRGFYPHVITRLEHNRQDQQARYNKWVSGGRK